MSTSNVDTTVINSTDEERREIYHVLDITRKLETGQVRLVPGRYMQGPPKGDFPEGVLNRVVRLYLSVNGYFLCTAVHYVFTDGTFYTEPDPKYIRIDDLEWKQ